MTLRKRILAKRMFVIAVVLLSIWILFIGIRGNKKTGETGILVKAFEQNMIEQMEKRFFLHSYYTRIKGRDSYRNSLALKAIGMEFPLYQFVMQNRAEIWCEANEEKETDFMFQLTSPDLMLEMQKENEQSMNKESEQGVELQIEEQASLNKEGKADETKRYDKERQSGEIEMSENQQEAPSKIFIPASEPATTYDWSEEWGRERLISHFFAIDQNTALQEKYLDLDHLLHEDMTIKKTSDQPQILIYHTHSQEAFADSVKGDPSTTIVGAGERLAELLRGYGFNVMHHLGEYDVDNRDYAYNNSMPEIEKLLKENPSIEVVIDLHRDEMDENTRLVTDIEGRETARFMFFNGMSYLKGKGEISYLENPYIEDNLAFAFQAQVIANEYYPGLTRRIYLKAYRYNMHFKPKSMLIELGAQNNTVEEIMNACDPLAHIISVVLTE